MMVTMLLAKIQSLIAFTIGRTLPNMDLSQDFMELVVVDCCGSWRGRSHHKEKEPGIEIALGLFDLFVLHWAYGLFCNRSFYALEENGKFCKTKLQVDYVISIHSPLATNNLMVRNEFEHHLWDCLARHRQMAMVCGKKMNSLIVSLGKLP